MKLQKVNSFIIMNVHFSRNLRIYVKKIFWSLRCNYFRFLLLSRKLPIGPICSRKTYKGLLEHICAMCFLRNKGKKVRFSTDFLFLRLSADARQTCLKSFPPILCTIMTQELTHGTQKQRRHLCLLTDSTNLWCFLHILVMMRIWDIYLIPFESLQMALLCFTFAHCFSQC